MNDYGLMPVSAFEAPETETTGRIGEIEQSIIDAIQEIEDSGQLAGKYKAIAVALRATARAVDEGLSRGGKVSVATAQLTQRLFDSIDKLPEPKIDTGSAFDTLELTVSEMTKQALGA